METYSKGRQRSVYIKDGIWRSIMVQAKKGGRSVSQYLSWLHQEHMSGPIKPQPIHGVIKDVDDIVIPEPKISSGGTSNADDFFNPYSKEHQTRKKQK